MIETMEAKTGEIRRADDSIINEGNILAPVPCMPETLTVADIATPLTTAKYAGALTAFVQVGAAPIRYWTYAEATPTTTEGIQLDPGDGVYLQSPDEIAGFKAIRTTDVSAVLQVAYGA